MPASTRSVISPPFSVVVREFEHRDDTLIAIRRQAQDQAELVVQTHRVSSDLRRVFQSKPPVVAQVPVVDCRLPMNCMTFLNRFVSSGPTRG